MISDSVISYPLAVDGVFTRILQSDGGGTPVVCVHGLGARADRWRATLPVLAAAGYNAIALDLPGHGFASKGGQAPATVPDLARFVLAVTESLDLPAGHWLGTSLGGHISAWIACRAAVPMRSLTLVGTVGILPIGRDAGLAIQASVQKTSREAIRSKLELVLHQTGLIHDPLIEEEYRINNSPGAADSFRRLGAYMVEQLDLDCMGTELAGRASSLPMLLAWGEQDRVVPVSLGQAIRTQLGLSEDSLCVIPKAGHAPYMEQPAQFHARLLPFLEQAAAAV